jgi:predicted PurR-regulated permease PerM
VDTSELSAPDPFFKQLMITTAVLLVIYLFVQLAERFAMILQQLLVAMFLTYLILPMYYWFHRRRVPSLLAYLIIVAIVVGAFTGLGFVLSASLNDLQMKLPEYQARFETRVREMTRWVPGFNEELVNRFLEDKPRTPDQTLQQVKYVLTTLSSFLSQAFVVLIYLLFLLAEMASFRRRVEAAFTPERTLQLHAVVTRINTSISHYIGIKTFMSFITGLLTYLALLIVGVDYAEVWGLLAFLFNYIPYLGSVVAVALPFLLSLVQFEGFTRPFLVLVLLLLAQNVVAYAVEPGITGRGLNLSPMVIILSLAFWGALWGIVGMILAVPLMVVIKTILENIPATQPTARLLSNQ